jgi:hypothetical protein
MTSFVRAVLPAVAVALFGLACGGRSEADDTAPRRSAGEAAPSDTAPWVPVPAGSPDSAAAPASAATAVVRYEHLRTCPRFMGREGQFFVYRITGVENRGAEPFTFEAAQLRFGEGGTAPALSVPEFSELEAVAGGATAGADELYLLERAAPGAPPRGPVPLAYGAGGVEMARGGVGPVYDQGPGCDELNT